jgi:YVTN family beta-propeller protein
MARKYVFTHLYDAEAEVQSARALLTKKFPTLIEKISIIPAPYGFILQVDTKEIADNLFEGIKAEIEPASASKVSRKPEKPSSPPKQEVTEKPAVDKPAPKPEPKPVRTAEAVAPDKKKPRPEVPKQKSVAIWLSVFFGLWSWLYTYKINKRKFWLNLILIPCTIGFWAVVAWIWAIVDAAVRPSDYYQGYPSVKADYPKKAYFSIILGSVAALVIIGVIGGYIFQGNSNNANPQETNKFAETASANSPVIKTPQSESGATATPTPTPTPSPTPTSTPTPTPTPTPTKTVTPTVTNTPIPTPPQKLNTLATINVGRYPLDIGVNPNTNRIYVANFWDDNISVIDGATNSVLATVKVGSAPNCLGVNPSTNRIYVANREGQSISVIDGATNSVLATVNLEDRRPTCLEVNPSTNRIYVTNLIGNDVLVIDGATNSVLATVNVGEFHDAIGVNPSTNRIYVANRPFEYVSVIDGATNRVLATVNATENVGIFRDIGVNPSTNRIYVTNREGESISVIDGATNSVLATVNLGYQPGCLRVNPSTNRIYVADLNNNDVSVIDGATNSVLATVNLGYKPMAIGVNPSTNRIYITSMTDNTLLVLEDNVPTSTPTPTPTLSPQLVFEDDFSNPGSGWFVGTDEKQEKKYENGEYSMFSKLTDTMVWQWDPYTYKKGLKDFTVEVDIRSLTTESQHAGGIVFRYQDNDNYYSYFVSNGGYYRIGKKILGKWTYMKNWTYSPYIKTGDNMNHLKVICTGTQIEVYINDYKLAEATDNSLTVGKILLTSCTWDIPGSHHHFDNFKLYEGAVMNSVTSPTPIPIPTTTSTPFPTTSDLSDFLGTWSEKWADINNAQSITISQVNGSPKVSVKGNWRVWGEKLENGVLSFRIRGGSSDWEFFYTVKKTLTGKMSLTVFRVHDQMTFEGEMYR